MENSKKSQLLDYDSKDTMDETPLQSKKYRTIGELKQAGIRSVILTTARMEKCMGRDLLDQWLWDTHYCKKEMVGNLTTRIANINNKICYREMMKRCFQNVDILSSSQIKSILTKECIDFIRELHSISPSLLGTFIDYLIRRIICELTCTHFQDNRSDDLTVPNHVCTNGCKLCIEVFTWLDTCSTCELPICQYLCYEKTKQTNTYKTVDIVLEIFITSLFHSEAFGGTPQQETFNRMYHELSSQKTIQFVQECTEMCTNLIQYHTTIHLNPALGGPLDGINVRIPSDADLVIDDRLFDIKCTASHPIREISQLLGYSSLLRLNSRYRTKINSVSIINLLSGQLTTYDIEFMTTDNCMTYIKMLSSPK